MSKVSIIMPAYNAREYISTAIDSIISQTYKDRELVVCDNCSSDNTVDIVEKYCRQHNNIVLIKRKENSGAARLPRKNASLATTGDFIMTFDADEFAHALIKRRLLWWDRLFGYKDATPAWHGTEYHCQLLNDIQRYKYPLNIIEKKLLKESRPCFRKVLIFIRKIVNTIRY